MTLDLTKVLIYVLVLGALAAGCWFFLFQPDVDEPPLMEAPGPVVVPPVATAPVLSPPCNCPEPPPPVVVITPVSEKPATKAKSPVAKAKPKAVVVKQGCGQVPVEAYQYPKDVVLAAAERRGTTAKDMATLRRCIGA